MNTFMFFFEIVFALLIGCAMITMGFVLSPSRYEKHKKVHTKT